MYMSKKVINGMTILSIVCIIGLIYWGYQCHLFQDVNSLKHFVLSTGYLAPIFFILIQIIQVVIPIIPGGVSSVAGVILFGPLYGLLYNYVGIVIGSFINFFLARYYGQGFVHKMVSDETYDKYASWLEKGNKFDTFFALAIFFPVAPDDFLCMLAGLTKMSLKKFSLIILLGKPASIATYSLAFVYGGTWIGNLLN